MRRPKHVKTEVGRIRRFRSPIFVFVCAFVFASGTAALAYSTTSVSGTGRAQAVTAHHPRCRQRLEPGGGELVPQFGRIVGTTCARGVPRPPEHLVRRTLRKGFEWDV